MKDEVELKEEEKRKRGAAALDHLVRPLLHSVTDLDEVTGLDSHISDYIQLV